VSNLRDLLNRDYEDFRNVAITDGDFALRLEYTWGNATLFVPDPESQEWKDLEYENDIRQWPCVANVPEKCPHILRFLKHHYVGRLIPTDRKVKPWRAIRFGGVKSEMKSTFIPVELRC
jgi:hypothetical protein